MEPPVLPTHRRYHDFDALRSGAMLLGIVLHGMMSLVPLPVAIWPAQDLAQAPVYLFLLHAIHGFRLQLFFVLSGFFAVMMWKKYGLKNLLKHRCKRILLPLVVFTSVLMPILFAISIYGINAGAQPDSGRSIWAAAKAGDAKAIEQHIKNGADPSKPDTTGMTPLGWAAALGGVSAAETLVKHGADIHQKDSDGATALHTAAFFGNMDMVQFLVTAGVDVNAATVLGDTPLDASQTEELSSIMLAELIGISVDETQLLDDREIVFEYLKENGAEFGAVDLEEPLAWFYPFIPGMKHLVNQLPMSGQSIFEIVVIFWLLSVFPIFQHLWFLYYLFMLVLGFVFFIWVARKRGWRPLPKRMVTLPLCLVWLVPLTAIPQFFMISDFGPDTAGSPVPWPPLLLYYAVFFGFGGACFGRNIFENAGTRRWPLTLLLAVPVLLLGLHAYEMRGSFFEPTQSATLSAFLGWNLLCSVFSALYAWLMIFGLIGLFRKICSGENPRVRYLSDASYWLYIAHLPVTMLLQVWIADVAWPGWLKLLGICVVTLALLLAVYEVAVRYTWVGAMLNGRKTREKSQ